MPTNLNMVSDDVIREYVERNIGEFHLKRVERLNELQLRQLLRRKNPYLFRAKAIGSVPDLVKPMLDAHLSSQEETFFGDFLEGLARHICEVARNGRASGIEGVDLEFDDDGTRYIVSLKSGPNWGNSDQIKQMRTNFRRASQTLRQNNTALQVQAVNGCCYGRTTRRFDRGDYWKLSGQGFWTLLTDDPEFYTRIIDPLAHQARERNDDFMLAYDTVLNRLVAEFMADFATEDYQIDWSALVKFNSESAARSGRS